MISKKVCMVICAGLYAIAAYWSGFASAAILQAAKKTPKVPTEPKPEPEKRHITLLKATVDLLTKQKNSGVVLDILTETVEYDETDCDGYCLLQDIKDYLEYEAEEELNSTETR